MENTVTYVKIHNVVASTKKPVRGADKLHGAMQFVGRGGYLNRKGRKGR